jgi:Domain of unknown function (DUF4389)
MGVLVTAYPSYQAYPGPAPVPFAPPPVLLAVVAPAPQRRLTVALRLILAVPHLIVLALISVAACVVAFLGWWGALFTARLPGFAVNFLSGYVRWSTRVTAYLLLLTEEYPRFSPDDDPGYPVQVSFPEPQRLNRAAVFFRIILLVPASILSQIVDYGLGVLAFVAWVITLVTGRLPASFHLAFSAALRFQTRFYSYQLMLTPAYPGGLYGDQPGTGPVPGFEAPVPGYGAEGGYGFAPAAQPGPWALPLTRAAKGLVTTIIVLGALGLIGQNVYNNETANSNGQGTSYNYSVGF